MSSHISALHQSCRSCLQVTQQVAQHCEAGSAEFLPLLEQLRSQLRDRERLWRKWEVFQGSTLSAAIEPEHRQCIHELAQSTKELMEMLNQLERQLAMRRDTIAPRIDRLRNETRGRSEYLRAMQ